VLPFRYRYEIAALLAASVLALSNEDIAKALDDYRARQTAAVNEDPKSS